MFNDNTFKCYVGDLMRKNQVYISVDVEEWFHSDWFDISKVINTHFDGKFPKTDVEQTTRKLIETFDEYDVKGTFFVLGETAHIYPEIIEMLEGSNHEIACHGYYHNKKYNNLDEFRIDIKKYKNEIKSDLTGFRFPNFDYSNEKFEILLENGFKYDSSIVPCLNIPGWYGNPKSPMKPYKLTLGDGKHITEVPISVLPYLRFPGAGGWYIRNFGYYWTKNLIKLSLRKLGYAMLYVHPWEISNENPDLKEIPFHVFRNTGTKTLNNLKSIIESFPESDFLTILEGIKKWK